MADQRFSAASLGPRVVTGLVLAVMLVTGWIVGGLAIFGLIAVVAMLAQWECYSLFLPAKHDIPAKVLGMILGAGFLAVVWFAPTFPPHLALVAAMLVLAIYTLANWTKETSLPRLRQSAVILGGLVYIPLLLAQALGFSPLEQVLIVAVPALSDIAAYFTGVRFGKHKIWTAVSPKKSVEGAMAGLAVAVVVSLGFGGYAGTVPLWNFLFLGFILGIAAQLGDFFESALKRSVDIKDSGKLLPGHGGMLDRIDSVLFACAAYAVASACVPFFG